MSLVKWIWHGLTHCPKADLERTMYGTTHCAKCGRVTFVSDTLPVIKRFKLNKRAHYA